MKNDIYISRKNKDKNNNLMQARSLIIKENGEKCKTTLP